MSYVGGFYELELPLKKGNNFHADALALTNARACLSLILSVTNAAKVYVPFYTCNALLEPLIQKGVEYSFYALNEELEIKDEFELKAHEYVVYVNYFGLKTEYTQKLMTLYGRKLILDNTQAFFYKDYKEVWAFNSARKFFGVPDGGYLYGMDGEVPEIESNTSIKLDHLVNRLLGRQEEAYQDFMSYEQTLNSEIKGISKISEALLSQVNYEEAIRIRRKNFATYENAFKDINRLKLSMASDEIPFSYPLLLDNKIDKSLLYKQGLFIPTLWPDAITQEGGSFEFERQFSAHLLPLPLDHRYGTEECQRVIEAVSELTFHG